MSELDDAIAAASARQSQFNTVIPQSDVNTPVVPLVATPALGDTSAALDNEIAKANANKQAFAAVNPPPPPVDNWQAFKNDVIKPFTDNWLATAPLSEPDYLASEANAGRPYNVDQVKKTLDADTGTDKPASYSKDYTGTLAATLGGAGGAVSGAGPLAVLPGMAPLIAAGGAAQGGTTQITGSPVWGTVAGVMTPFGAGLPGGAWNLLKRSVSEAPSEAPAIADAATAAANKLRDQYTGSQAGQWGSQAADFERSLTDVPGAPIASPAAVGSLIKDKSLAFIEGNGQATADRYAQFEKQVPPTTTIPGATDNLTAHLEATDAATAKGSPPPPPEYSQIQSALDKNPDLTYQQLKEWRSTIGKKMAVDSIDNQGANYSAYTKMYDELSNSMKGMIEKTAGQDGLDAFAANNAAYKDGQNFIQQKVAKLADEGNTPEAIGRKLTNANSGTTLNEMYNRGVLDNADLNIIARQQLNNLGYDSRFDMWRPELFNANIAKMERVAPEQAQLLFSRNPDLENRFNSLKQSAKILDTIENSPQTAANSSRGMLGTFVNKAVRMGAGLIGSGVGAKFGSVGAMAGDIGGEIAVNALTPSQVSKSIYSLSQRPYFAGILTKRLSDPVKASAFIAAQALFHPEDKADLQTISDAIKATTTP
jgi:hypothetical protein